MTSSIPLGHQPPCLARQPPPQLRDGDALKRRPDMDTDKDMSAAVIEGNDAVTGHIISTTIGGKNGEPKQTISYMAERVVGTG
ncbi:hypothetical protein F2Q69_00011753 [Brassica cretica]|uniref:Uncharacterized protein n=1 Tax=Brassica cretica TaxID=69181 RepID=A0A8S9QSJ0_BRACR|nr:hypothetical protein F2Q69_00011753 [Brassica cretica]